jgi:RNA polymerase sigma factor (TIGR02999 family)
VSCSDSADSQVTALLQAWGQGDEHALERLFPLVYGELHWRARRYLAHERGENTFQATALVNEAYLRLVDAADVGWQGRAHFFALSAEIMRRILVDAARSRRAEKRGGQEIRVTLDDGVGALHRDDDLVRLDDALAALAKLDQRKARVIELRFFGGLSVDETAEVLHVSPQTVLRDWTLAKAWLAREIKHENRT